MKKTWTSKKKKNKNTLVNLKGEVKIRCWVKHALLHLDYSCPFQMYQFHDFYLAEMT